MSPAVLSAYGRETAIRCARSAAFTALKAMHPDDWAALYAAELKAAGVREPALEMPCPCGGTLRRPDMRNRWPDRCETCKEET